MKTTKELKEIYEANPSEWIVLLKNTDRWVEPQFPFSESMKLTYKLIHIKHKQVLEAYLADNSVGIEYKLGDTWFNQHDRFITEYDSKIEYRLKETEMAKQTEVNLKPDYSDNTRKEKEDGLDRIGHSDDANSVLYSVTGGNSGIQLNNFQDFDFTADFEGEILKEVGNILIGWILYPDNSVCPISWKLNGKGIGSNTSNYNLTPAKKEIEVEKIVAYEFCGQGAVESREVVTIAQDYWDKLSNGKLDEKR